MPWDTRVCLFLCQCLCLVHTHSCRYVCVPVCVFDTGVSLRKRLRLCAPAFLSVCCVWLSVCLCVSVVRQSSLCLQRMIVRVCDRERLCVCYYVMLGCFCLCLCQGLAVSVCVVVRVTRRSLCLSPCLYVCVCLHLCRAAFVLVWLWLCVTVRLCLAMSGCVCLCHSTVSTTSVYTPGLRDEVFVPTLIIRPSFRIELERRLSHVETKQTAPNCCTTWQRHASGLCDFVSVFFVSKTTERAHGGKAKEWGIRVKFECLSRKNEIYKLSKKKSDISVPKVREGCKAILLN